MAANSESIPVAAPTAKAFPRWLVAVITLVLVVADQVSKRVVERMIPEHSLVPAIPGFLNLTHTKNTGVAFGLFSYSPAAWKIALLALASAALLAIVVYMVWRAKHLGRATGLGLALILGGAMSNLADRIRTGAVVDFVDAYIRSFHWYTFNLADSAITVGAVLLVIHLIRSE